MIEDTPNICSKGGWHVRTIDRIYIGRSWVVTVDDLLRFQRMQDRGNRDGEYRYATVCAKCRKELP